jgi:FAD/FMN-containing dehydrogenase
MKDVRVDAAKKRAHVQPGATLADFDAATQAHKLATPVGINSTTGVAGLTLGGGFGWLTRKYGMTVDSLVSADVVTADGRTLHASEQDNADLFWAIRGGGGNFGVVTGFEFELYPVGPEITAGLIVFPASQTKQVLEHYRTYAETTPEEFNAWVVLRQAPPLPFLPEEVHGKDVLVMAVFHAGDPAQADKWIAPIHTWGDPVGAHVGVQPYVQWQQAFDPLLTPGARNYWKSHNFTELADGLFDAMAEYAGRMPSPHCEIFIGLIAGAPNRVAADAMAWAHRDAKFVLNVHGRWETAAEDQSVIGWARDFFKASQPFASAGAYTNFMTQEEGDRVEAAYGPSYARLKKIKQKFDPDNVFRNNQNIKP